MKKGRDLGILTCLTQPLPSGTKNMLIFFEAKEPSIQKLKNRRRLNILEIVNTPVFGCQPDLSRHPNIYNIGKIPVGFIPVLRDVVSGFWRQILYILQY